MNSYAMLMQTVPTLMAHTTASANLDLLEMVPVVQVGVLLKAFRFQDEIYFVYSWTYITPDSFMVVLSPETLAQLFWFIEGV